MTVAVASPVAEYAEAVISGEVVAGRMVRLACERHLRDLEHGSERGLWFDDEAAQASFDFFETVLCFYEGEDAGKPFLLQPFQKFIIGSLRGWKLANGDRRYRKAYCELGKGNGKTPTAAGIGLEDLVVGSIEAPGSQIYAAAMTRDAANLMFKDAKLMADASPALKKRLDIGQHSISYLRTNSYFQPVSGEANNLHGKRVRTALIDEIHAHPSAHVVDFLQKGTKGPGNRLILEITNSGYDRTSICWQHHEYSRQILEQSLEDDGWFAYVCQLDVCAKCRAAGKDQPTDGCKTGCDQWTDPATWPKANPNVGVSVTHQYLAEQVREAIGIPAQQNDTKRLNFCIWTESVSKWLDMDVWRQAPEPRSLAELAGKPCFGGLDLASVSDFTALALLFPDDDGWYDLLAYFWLPDIAVAERRRKGNIPIGQWIDDGFISVTGGDMADYGLIQEQIVEIGSQFEIRETGYDGHQALQMATYLDGAGFEMVKLAQSFGTYTEPMREFERVLKLGKIRVRNPVLTWMASNVAVEHGPNQTRRPSKDKSQEKIDGVVAALMAISRAMVAPTNEPWHGIWIPGDDE